MSVIASISPSGCTRCVYGAGTNTERPTRSKPERTFHSPQDFLPRHAHGRGFAALVLSGSYVEAGDTGRHLMEAGDVLLHRAWEGHLDRFGGRGAEVLVVEIDDHRSLDPVGRIADVDAIVRMAEQDLRGAAHCLVAQLESKPVTISDWPDLLAATLRANPFISLAEWAAQMGLHAGSLSRGFAQVFGMTPLCYRVSQRSLKAIVAVTTTDAPLCQIALDCGFSDQAHMTRAVSALAQATPARLRRRSTQTRLFGDLPAADHNG